MLFMRNISFSLTTKQFNDRTKTVTRRLGWKFLKPGDRLMGCEKCMGLKRGESPEKLHALEVVTVMREQLQHIYIHGDNEMAREGFPELSYEGFIQMFVSHMNCSDDAVVTRIEFKHL